MRTGRRPKGARLYLRNRLGRDAVWIIRDGPKQIGTGCGEKDVAGAERALAGYLADRYQPPTGPAALDRLLVADIMTVYLRERAPNVRRPDFLAVTAAPIIDWWGEKTLATIKGQSCRDYVTWRTGQGVKAATARHDLKTLRAAINYYHREHGPLPAVPAVTMPAPAPPRERWLTRSEAAALLRAAGHGHLARLILIGLGTGTRLDAMLRLSWLPSLVGGWVDLDAGVMHRRGAREIETAKRRPPVRLPRSLVAHMRRWQAVDLAGGIPHVIHWQGAPVTKLRRSWATARARAGLGPDVIPHTLRHTCATWLMQAGVDHYEAAGFLGMSVETLERVYGHHDPAFQERAANVRRRNAAETTVKSRQ